MTLYEHARNAFAIIGLLTTSGVIGLVGWHAVVAFRRFRANRPARLRERAIAAVRKAPIPSPLGVNRALGEAMKLAKSPDAHFLPGWCGPVV